MRCKTCVMVNDVCYKCGTTMEEIKELTRNGGNAIVVMSPKLTPELWREAFEIAKQNGLFDPQLFDMSQKPDIELPEGLVWVGMNGPDEPHWEVRGTGAIL